jgi:hypothetical protein
MFLIRDRGGGMRRHMMLALCTVTIILTGLHVCQIAVIVIIVVAAAVYLSERLAVLKIVNMRLVVPTAAYILCLIQYFLVLKKYPLFKMSDKS